jgi:hypothetical protein
MGAPRWLACRQRRKALEFLNRDRDLDNAMNASGYRLKKFVQRLLPQAPCPEIHWAEVIRIDAMGTDAFSDFQIWLTFTHADGGTARVFIETRGYFEIIESLHKRFPSIPPNWYDEMAEQPWHVEKVLYETAAD